MNRHFLQQIVCCHCCWWKPWNCSTVLLLLFLRHRKFSKKAVTLLSHFLGYEITALYYFEKQSGWFKVDVWSNLLSIIILKWCLCFLPLCLYYTCLHNHIIPVIFFLPFFLTGQFWHLGFEIEEFNNETFYDGTTRDNGYKVTHPPGLSSNSFVGLGYGIAWDYREEMCIYVGDNQASSSILVSDPADPVILGSYLDYEVDEPYGDHFKYSVFDKHAGCSS